MRSPLTAPILTCSFLLLVGFAIPSTALGAGAWHPSLKEARAAAKQSDKDILVYFYSTRARLCVEIRRQMLSGAFPKHLRRGYEMTQVDVSEDDEDLFARLAPNAFKTPVIVILFPTGESKQTLSDLGSTSGWRSRLEGLLRRKNIRRPGKAAPAPTLGPVTPVNPKDLIEQARAHPRANRLGKAEKLLKRVLIEEPGNTEALRILGAIAGNRGKYKEAADYFRLALKNAPHNKRARAGLRKAEELLRRQMLPQAIIMEGPAPTPLKMPPRPTKESAEIRKLLDFARKQVDQKNFEVAKKFYQRALNKDARNIEALKGLADVETRRGNSAKAAEYWRRVLKIAPRDRQARRALKNDEMRNEK